MYTTFVGNPYMIFDEGDAICTTTNGVVRSNGHAVMGAGNAKFVRDTFHVDKMLGDYLTKYGNRAFYLGEFFFPKRTGFENSFRKKVHLLTFPTKHNWQDKSDITLIEKSTEQIISIADKFKLNKIYIPIPGGSNGKLNWSQVKNNLSKLDERFIVYSLDANDFNK